MLVLTDSNLGLTHLVFIYSAQVPSRGEAAKQADALFLQHIL